MRCLSLLFYNSESTNSLTSLATAKTDNDTPVEGSISTLTTSPSHKATNAYVAAVTNEYEVYIIVCSIPSLIVYFFVVARV